MEDLQLIFVIGAPGAGKGTACKQLTEQRTKLIHLSVGDYLRELRDGNDILPSEAFGGLTSKQIRSTLAARELIAPEQVTAIIRYKLAQYRSHGYRVILLDGFPRSRDSADAFEREVGKPSMVLVFDCPRDTALSRFIERSRESGDDRNMFDKRYAEFERNHQVIVERYSELVKHVDTSGTRDDMYEQTRQCLEPFLGQDPAGDWTGTRLLAKSAEVNE